MKLFINLKTAYKITALVAILLAFMLGIGYSGYYAGALMSDKAKEIYNDRLLPVKWLNIARNHLRAVEADTWQLILAPIDQNQQKLLLEDIDKRAAEVNIFIQDYSNTKLDAYEKERLPKLNEALAQYRSERKVVLDLVAAGKKQEAYIYCVEKVMPKLKQVNLYFRELADYNAQVAENLNKETQAAAAFAVKLTVGATLVAIILGIAIAWFITRIIVNPLKEMLGSIAKDNNGYITIKRVNVVSTDEIGELGIALNDFTEQVRGIIKHVASSAEQIAASSEELTASAEQTAQVTNQVAISISEVAQGSEQQVCAVTEASAVIEQMSAGIQQVAANTNTVAGTSDKAATAAQSGGQSIETAVTQMRNIENTVSVSAQVVSKLGDRSKEIGQIVDTISGIAGQTNLLALNAAIEAARAGEQGRGFAVVAEEVRKLAEQSQEAAKQIAGLISEIQGDTGKAVTAMHDGTREVKLGTELVYNAGATFKEIVAMVNQVSDQVKEISAATQQMADGSQQIVASVRAIDTISKNTASQTQSVSAATEEQSATMEEIASSSQSLANLAQDLNNAIANFRV